MATANVSRPSAFQLLDADEFVFVAKAIKIDFPTMPFEILKTIIWSGTRSDFDGDKSFNINCAKFYIWIKKWIDKNVHKSAHLRKDYKDKSNTPLSIDEAYELEKAYNAKMKQQ